MVSLMTMPVLTSSTSKKSISPTELSQRVAVIKRFKELLQAQRDRFHTYLEALDKQKEVIEGGSADDLIAHVELEEKIVSDIFSIQQVIDPLEKMYHSVRFDRESTVKSGALKSAEKTACESEEVFGLKDALDGLKAEAATRSQQNRELLAKRMAELRSETKILKGGNAYARSRSAFGTPAASGLLDIRG